MAWTIRQMDDFAGWSGWGWLSPGGIPCLNPVFRLGPFGYVHIAPDVGATSFGSPPVANRAHRRSNLGRSARGVAVAAQLQGWMLARGISGACQITSEHFWIDGGLRGRARRLLGRGPTAPRRAALVHQRKPCHSRALPGDSRPFFAS